MHRSQFAPLIPVLLVLVVSLSLTQAQAADKEAAAAVIFLKDGFALRGYVRQDHDLAVDKFSGSVEVVPRGYYYLDDVSRRLYFSHHYVADAPQKPFDAGKEIKRHRPIVIQSPQPVPPIRDVLDPGVWDDNWDRDYKFRSPDGIVKVPQHLSLLTPLYATVDSFPRGNSKIAWRSFYRTQELGPQTVLALLAKHPDFKDTPGLTDEERVERRMQVVNFLAQSGWIDQAEGALARVAADYPAQRARLEASEGFRRLRALSRWDEIRLARETGRHRLARALLSSFVEEGAENRVLTEVRTLKEVYAAAEELYERARTRLQELIAQLPTGSEQEALRTAAETIRAELTLDEFLGKGDRVERGRLEPFLNQAERPVGTEKPEKPGPGARELLALAITGWVLGPTAAEARPETALRLWRTRTFLLAYQREREAISRGRLLREYGRQSDNPGVLEIAQMIGRLPPADPPLTPEGTGRLDLKAGRTRYSVQLPPEYQPTRSYPVLITLHNGGEDCRDALKRWTEAAGRNGYILVAPEWGSGIQTLYSYGPEEHAGLLEVVYELRRRFPVDSDRVFLNGFGEGANMAFDVGLAHPDLFAGLIPVAGSPRYHALKYWPNAQYLPVYAVWGDRMGYPEEGRKDIKSDGNRANYSLFKEWIPFGFPALGIQYRGRGREWFAGELDDFFDWMSRKRRAQPTKSLGYGGTGMAANVEFRTMRTGDNRFYWLSTNQIMPGCLNDGLENWNWSRTPATLAGQIPGGSNVINVKFVGVKQVSIWLSRGMVDFEQPVTVRFPGREKGGVVVRKPVPDLETLLEDFARRGDRGQLCLARLDFSF